MTEKRALSVEEVGMQLGVHPQTVRQHIRSGEIRAVRFGRRMLVPVSEVERLLGENNGHRSFCPNCGYELEPTP